VFNLKDFATLSPDHISQNRYHSASKASVIVLSDQKRVIAIRYNYWGSTRLEMFDITKKWSSGNSILDHNSPISSLLFEKTSKILFMGDSDNSLFQYKFQNNQLTMMKKYQNLGIGDISEGFLINHLLILGGSKYAIRVIYWEKMEVIGKAFKTAVKSINSLQVCKFENQKIQNDQYYLTVTGSKAYYSKDVSDVYEITKLIILDEKIKKMNDGQLPGGSIKDQIRWDDLQKFLPEKASEIAKTNPKLKRNKPDSSIKNLIVSNLTNPRNLIIFILVLILGDIFIFRIYFSKFIDTQKNQKKKTIKKGSTEVQKLNNEISFLNSKVIKLNRLIDEMSNDSMMSQKDQNKFKEINESRFKKNEFKVIFILSTNSF
jgi:hypothetical protein